MQVVYSLLMLSWLEQVTWLRPKSRGEETDPVHHEARASMYIYMEGNEVL